MKAQYAEKGTRDNQFPVADPDRGHASHEGSRTVLLISNDKQFHENLRSAANAVGLLVIKAERAAGTISIMQATRPVAVLLDLDVPNKAAWETAELLLKEPSCPAVILLTRRTAQFDTEAATRAGPLVSRGESPSCILKIIEGKLQRPEANQVERNAIQREVIRWLRPSMWTEPDTPAYRFWGINE